MMSLVMSEDSKNNIKKGIIMTKQEKCIIETILADVGLEPLFEYIAIEEKTHEVGQKSVKF